MNDDTVTLRPSRRWANSACSNAALNDVSESDANYDLRPYLRYDTAPIEVVRSDMASIGLGVYTNLFGEGFERAVAQNVYNFYNQRNRKSGLDLYARLLEIFYVHSFTLTGNERTGLTLCITSILGSTLSNAAINDEVTRALKWLLPHWTGNRTLSIMTCHEDNVSIVVTPAFKSIYRGVFRAV